MQSALASADCPIVEAQLTKQQHAPSKIQLIGMQFDDNRQDLAIIETLSSNSIKQHRITFGGSLKKLSETCAIVPLALVQGGDWGWHVFWQTPQGLFYARVDGEAWVSSVPKNLSKFKPINAQFNLEGLNIKAAWQHAEQGITSNIQAISSDEGRSWHIGAAPP